MDGLGQEERDHLEANIAWLASADPDDWHRVALDFNWGAPLYVLDWIVRQPNCDMATALTIFWKGEPGCWIEEEGSEPEAPNGFSYLNKLICAYVAKRIAAGGYSRSKIAFVPQVLWKTDYVEMEAEVQQLAKPNFPIHPDLIRKRRGRRVENDAAFYARYPEDFHHSSDMGDVSDTPQSIALMERVRHIEQAALNLLPAWLRS